MDCLNNMVCGDATIIGDKVYKKCVPEGSLAEGQSCVSNKACASGFCASKDSKTGVGTCSIEGGEAGKVAALNKTSCEKNSGEWVAGAGKDGKGACYAKATPISLSTEIGGKKEVAGLGDYLLTVFNVAMALGAGFAVLMVMVGGFMYMAGGGNPSKLTLAKQYIFGSLSGLILVLFGYLLFNTINPALIKMKPIAMPMVAPQGVKCCKQGLALEFSFGDKCKAGWKEVTAAECQTGITFGGPCCVNKSEPGNNTKCHALGGICFPAEYLSTSGPCTTLAKLTAAATVIAAGGVAVGAEGATAIAKAGWSVTKWGAGKLWTICKANVVGCFTTIVGVTAASEIADVLSALSLSCTQENLGTCMKGGGEPDGTMCSLDEQCMAGSKCLITLPAFACWGGKGVGFCSSGNPGSICKDDEVGGAGLGGCVKASNGKTVYCAAYSSYPGSTSALCSVGAEGQTCWTKDSKDMGICQAGLKCNSKGLCINASVQGTEKVLCSSNADCAADGFCATDNDWTCAYSPGVPGCIKSLWEGVVATGNCYKKVSAGGACITNVQCLSGTCTANKCS
jgi:hypothetical protein